MTTTATNAEPPWLGPPAGLAARFGDYAWRLAYQSWGNSSVYRLDHGRAPGLFVKLADVGHYPTMADEARRTAWAAPYLPVPEVVAHGTEANVQWLVTRAMPGLDATRPGAAGSVRELARILGRGLRRFHDALPVARCPFDFRVVEALGHVRSRLATGLIDAERDFHEEFAHLTPEGAVGLLESTAPATEDLVVCHGDYCLPNVLIADGEAVGFLDLGEVGVADRWWDLAVATWSVTWNLGPGHEDTFLEAYGAPPDDERMRFFRLLYDLVS